MPKFNHPNLGDVCRSAYLPGRILAVYHANHHTSPAGWDTADVLDIGSGTEYKGCPIVYHCDGTAQRRANEAIEGGARGFVEGDEVILLCKLADGTKIDTPASKVYVFGHILGPRKCAYNFVLTRISREPLKPIELPLVEEDHIGEYCTVYDVVYGDVALMRDPHDLTQFIQFPCALNKLKYFLDMCELHGTDLWEYGPQGDSSYRIAGATPDWHSDSSGADIGVGPCFGDNVGNWFNYDRCFQLFDDLRLANMIDFSGAIDGSFSRTEDIWSASAPLYDKWDAASSGVSKATIHAGCLGGSFNNTNASVSESAQESIQAINEQIATIRSFISRLASEIGTYGDTIQALDRAYSEASIELAETEARLGEEAETLANIRLIRVLLARRLEIKALLESIPLQKEEAVTQLNLRNDRIEKLYEDINARNADIRAILVGEKVPGAWGYAMDKEGQELYSDSLHAQVAYGEDEVYACLPPMMTDGKGNITTFPGCDEAWKFLRLYRIPPVISSITWHLGVLKMVREGCYNRTTCPAIKEHGKFFGPGSYRLKTTPIPNDPLAPQSFSALNTRIEHVNTWERYDNWNNSLGASFTTPGVDRTWWFRSYAQQWRYRMVFVDTPIGSIFCAAPHIQVALWYIYRLQFSHGTNMARQDWPLKNDFHKIAKHSANLVCQVYVVQRQGITFWNEHSTPAEHFTIQHAGWGPYDCHYWQSVVPDPVAEDGRPSLPHPNDPVAFIRNNGNLVGHVSEVDNLTPYMNPRSYVRTYEPDEVQPPPRGPLTNSMHEVEVAASVDLYNALQKQFGRKHPNDQVRNPMFEKAVEDLIRYYYSVEGVPNTELQYFNLDVEVI